MTPTLLLLCALHAAVVPLPAPTPSNGVALARAVASSRAHTCDAGAASARSASVSGVLNSQTTDAWFGEDKQRHLAMAFFTTTVVHAGGRLVGLDGGEATALGVAAAAAASVGKEVFDRRAGGPFSFRDLVWDAAGIALGVLLVEGTR